MKRALNLSNSQGVTESSEPPISDARRPFSFRQISRSAALRVTVGTGLLRSRISPSSSESADDDALQIRIGAQPKMNATVTGGEVAAISVCTAPRFNASGASALV